MIEVFWTESVLEVYLEPPSKEQQLIQESVHYLESFPDMYPIRRKGRFRGHHFFIAGNWVVYYRHKRDGVYIRGLWPARIP